MGQRLIRVGTRASALARAQTTAVVALLQEHYPNMQVEVVPTRSEQPRIAVPFESRAFSAPAAPPQPEPVAAASIAPAATIVPKFELPVAELTDSPPRFLPKLDLSGDAIRALIA